MTTPTVPPPARRGKRGILSAAFRFKLGGISKSTFHRLERTDPRFPRPGRLRNQKIWDEGVADDYVELVISDPDREEAVAATNGERSRHIAEPEPDTASATWNRRAAADHPAARTSERKLPQLREPTDATARTLAAWEALP